MAKSFEKDLRNINEMLSFFEELVVKYPTGPYQSSIDHLKKQRAELTDKIGKK